MRILLLVCLGLGLASLNASGSAWEQAAKKQPSEEPLAQGKPLRYWIDQLKDDDVLTREEAIEVLAELGPAAKEAVPALRRFLKDEQATVRFRAAVAL